MTELVRKHEYSKKLYSVVKESRTYLRESNIKEQRELNHNLPQEKLQKKPRKKKTNKQTKAKTKQKNETESKVLKV